MDKLAEQSQCANISMPVVGKNNHLMPFRSLLIALLCGMLPAVAAPAQTKARVLKFPDQYSVGILYDVPALTPLEANIRGTPMSPAKGTVHIAAGKWIKFEPNSRFFEHPECLQALPPEGLDVMQLKFVSVGEQDTYYCDRALKYVSLLTGLKKISVDNSDTTNDGIKNLASLTNLDALSATGTMVTSECLKVLLPCKKIQFIRLGLCSVKEGDLVYLKQFPALQRLSLKHARLTPAAMPHIARCQGLVNLDISENPAIDDSCVKYLTQLKNLKELCLRGTAVSVKGVEELSHQKIATLDLSPASFSKAQREHISKLFWHANFEGIPLGDAGETNKILSPITR